MRHQGQGGVLDPETFLNFTNPRLGMSPVTGIQSTRSLVLKYFQCSFYSPMSYPQKQPKFNYCSHGCYQQAVQELHTLVSLSVVDPRTLERGHTQHELSSISLSRMNLGQLGGSLDQAIPGCPAR